MEQSQNNVFSPPSTLETVAHLRSVLSQVMHIETHVIHVPPVDVIEFVGQLTVPSEEAFDLIYMRFTDLGYTPMLTRRDDGKEIVVAKHGIVEPTPNRNSTNLILLILTIISTVLVGTTLYGGEALVKFIPANADQGDIFAIFGIVLSHPQLLLSGLPYALTLLGILGVHEMGHYVMARVHKAAVTLPFFIPMPIGLGTMGAVIRLKSPIKNRKQLFDIGIAGPLAGLAIAIPLLIVGLVMSPVEFVGKPIPGGQEGNSILYFLLKLIIKGRALPGGGYDVILSTIAFPAWFGLIVTMINLLPIGQLDGGHIIYSIFGRTQWRVASIAIFGLIGLGAYLAYTTGEIINVWLLWVLLAQVFGLRHPPPLDDITPLDRRRKLIGYATIVIFILIFTPIPFS
ncbi:MAG TPA: site-2 protease family protein [Anaerolineae bacterium]|nr:site-2 protease family protein [Anaerolineae bacterium]